jgi:hypothetical protein
MTALPSGTTSNGPSGESDRYSTTVAPASGAPSTARTKPLGSM